MKRSNISKNEILKIININLGIPLSLSEKFIDEMLNIIIEGLNTQRLVKITGFGTFKILEKKQRIGRNPKTGQTYEIKARRTVVFRPSKKFKHMINE